MKNKKSAIATLALVIMLTSTILAASLGSVSAQSLVYVDTYGYITVVPTTVGVNQQVIVTFGIDKTSPTASFTRGNWEDMTVKITKPDGTTETKGPFTAYSMANTYFMYAPTQVGEYTFEGNFPGQWINGSYRTVTNRGSWSNGSSLPLTEATWWFKPCAISTTMTVQEEPIPSYPEIPLPEVYKRPLNGEIKGWSSIADNWLMPKYDETSAWRFSATAFAPYASAPNSAHILWKQPVTFGGVAGGPYGDESYRTGLSYEPFYSYSLMVNGRIYYDDHGPTRSSVYGTRCIDMYTGEEIYYLEGVNIDFAQILMFDSGNEHGPMTYLWETTNSEWYMYDAYSGRKILTLTNMNGLTGTTKFGPRGEILSYRMSGTDPNRQLTLWNSSLAIAGEMTNYWSPPHEGTVDGIDGIQWNVTMSSTPQDPTSSMSIMNVNVEENVLITAYNDHTQYPHIMGQEAYPALLDKDTLGNYPTTINKLWSKERQSETERESYTNIRDGVFARWDQATRQYFGYSTQTGAELWATDPVPMGWGLFTAGSYIAYGKLYSGFFDGHIRAWDITDGSIAWDFYMGDTPYLETAYGSLPAYGFTIADGKIYVTNDEHSPDSVLWRGGKLWTLDAETGELLWAISGRLRQATVSDGILTAFNLYDNQIWTFGKGPSKTTVTAPKTQVMLGEKIVIEGTVTDQTPATKDTPAVSDESMAAWMEYLHMQKPIPTDVVGVEVTLDVIDANGNYRSIGTATSDISGVYSLVWEPDIPGKFTIIATFAGSESYASSFAETSFYVEEQGTPVSSPEPAPAPQTDAYIVASTIAILVGLGIVAFLLLRKKEK